MQRPPWHGQHDDGKYSGVMVLYSPLFGNSPFRCPAVLQPAEFQANVMASLNYLDTVLPAGSLVLAIGLVDGRVLWNTMHGTNSIVRSWRYGIQ